MNKIVLILRREFLTRVRKKSFIIMSILGPIIFAAFLIVPAWLAQLEDDDEKLIAVIDESGLFINAIPETETIKFEYLENTTIEELKNNIFESEYYAILFIPEEIDSTGSNIELSSPKQPGLSVTNHIANTIEDHIEKQKLQAYNIQDLELILQSIETNIQIQTIKLTDNGEEKESSAEIAMVIGYISGFLIYLFIFMFGIQVMRGVIEEKISRIVEVIISSVKPFQLMMGKIVGIALVGLTQFIIWISLTAIIIISLQFVFLSDKTTSNEEDIVIENLISSNSVNNIESNKSTSFSKDEMQNEFKDIFIKFKNLPLRLIFTCFLFYFLAGYLLYGSLFALVGSAVDNETDTQQFMMPITIPLILSMLIMLNVIQNPESSIAFWFSMIPLTSPIVMMVRIPFEPPLWEIGLSMGILILSFIGTTWLAGKVYRTGILMYGKKVNYKEIWKWIRYSN